MDSQLSMVTLMISMDRYQSVGRMASENGNQFLEDLWIG